MGGQNLKFFETWFLRVLTEKFWFSVNMLSQKGNKYWAQLPKTMKCCQNVPNMYILNDNKFEVWKILVSAGWKIFLLGRSKFKIFWNLTFSSYFYRQNGICIKSWVKTKQISWFYNVFGLGVWPEWFYSSCNAPSQSSHKRWTQPPRSMKFCKDVPYMYILKVKKFWVCACLRLDSIEKI